MSGKADLFFYGWASYNDIFEGTSTHVTKFCWQAQVKGSDPEAPSGGIEWNFGPFGPYNWIDSPHT
jgi:hypothetical protein